MAQTAIQIDPSLPEVHWVIGYVRAQQRRHEEALAHLDRALNLSPSFADALALKGGIHTYIGDPAGAVPLLRRAMRLSPEAGYLYFLLLGRTYFFLDDTEQSLINLREAIARNPASLEARVYLSAALSRAGDQDAAEWEAEELRAIQPEFTTRGWLATYPMTDQPQRERLVSVLAGLGL
jgi:tetratricopeptide (TPR) repeat protein